MKAARKLVLNILAAVVLILVVITAWLLLFQHRMIYYPRKYSPTELTDGADLERLRFNAAAGPQTAFYLPPASGALPRAIWVMFAGNASLALDWTFFVRAFPANDTGFLLVDYPGYGLNAGSASPQSIAENANRALDTLRKKLGPNSEFELNILGNSLGGSAALLLTSAELAAGRPVKRLILLAPFTTLSAMAERAVGPIFAKLLHHHFDNETRLKEVLAAASPPKITIFHGSIDEVVPVTMGRSLAAADPERITYREYRGEMHNSLLVKAQQDIYEAMTVN